MNAPFDPSSLTAERFAVGQPVSRKEDPVLLRGEGRYTDDVNCPGQLYAVMVRSRMAHGVLGSIDVTAARETAGVRAVILAEDLDAAGIRNMPAAAGKNFDGSATPRPAQRPLAAGRVRYVGEPIAMVVAETSKLAKDAAEAVFAEIDALPAVTTAGDAAAVDAPLVHDDAPGNVCLDVHFGDTDKVSAAFAEAAHVTRLSLRNNRIVVCPMEPRSAIGEFDAAKGRLVLRLGCQGVFGQRALLSGIMAVPVENLQVLTGNVGGSFGMKSGAYPEYVCLLHAARTLGQPVKWTDERSESFMSDSHGRDHEMLAELALDAAGTFLALRVSGYGNLGAWLSNATTIPPTVNTVKNIIGVYATPLIEVSTKCLFTNITPVGAYLGAGCPEGNYYMERLVETAAREMGIDRVELRRRNHIQPQQMPYKAPSGMVYDGGEFPAVMEKALLAADWNGYVARQAASRMRGKIRGRGIGHYLEVTADAGNEMDGIRFEDDGNVKIITGTLDYGQGHASPFAQVLSGQLGVPFEKIKLLQEDSDELLAGGGTGGSRSMMQSRGAIVEASGLVIERGKQAAAHFLEAAVTDIEFSRGRFTIAGTDRSIGIMDLAERLRLAVRLPEDIPQTLNVSHVFKGVPSAFPNGCHIAEIELDPDTGVVEVVSYATVNDFGVLVNPMLVEGQAHGGIAQGIGQALMESVAYDDDGQLITGSYMDYALPRANDFPGMGFISHPVPALTDRMNTTAGRISVVSRLSRHPLDLLISEPLSAATAAWKVDAVWIGGIVALGCLAMAATVFLTVRRFRDQQQLAAAAVMLEIDWERDRADQEVAEQHATFGMALNNMSQGLMMFDLADHLLLANMAIEKIFGLAPGSLQPGMTPTDIVVALADAGNVLRQDIAATASVYQGLVQRRVKAQFIRKLSDGRLLSGNFAPHDNGWLLTFENITEMRKADERIAHMAHHDALTGLANRVALRARTEEALAAIGDGGMFAIVCLDLDRFKDVNDTLGHSAGDKLLCEVTKRIQSVTRPSDIVGRLGGDEFAIVLSPADSRTVIAGIAGRLVEVIAAPFKIDNQMVFVGASVGIALAPVDGADPDMLMKSADRAMYRAKGDGRGRFVFFEPSMEHHAVERLRIEHELHDALSLGELHLYYQPLVRIATRRIVGFEGLLRWHHPTRGVLSAAEFIPVAEQSGLIVRIGEQVLHAACMEAACWPDGIKVAVNLSPAQFRGGRLLQAIKAALRLSGLAANRLEIEITEGTMMQDVDATLAALAEIKALGIRVALDGFGTGYSSLVYLQKFPFDKVKIDRSFIRDVAQASNLAIVRAVAGIGESLGIETTAEGVETARQFAIVRDAGCSEAQGYLFSQPRPANEIAAILDQEGSFAAACGEDEAAEAERLVEQVTP